MQGRIYKIVDNTKTKSDYYGSTTLSIYDRLRQHKQDFTRYTNNKAKYKRLFMRSFFILELNNYTIEEVETVTYEDPKELKRRELYYIQNYECINKNRPAQFVKENQKEYNHQYYINNKSKWKKKYY
jgi:hypothetical protein